jgi:hypothetical protein
MYAFRTVFLKMLHYGFFCIGLNILGELKMLFGKNQRKKSCDVILPLSGNADAFPTIIAATQ